MQKGGRGKEGEGGKDGGEEKRVVSRKRERERERERERVGGREVRGIKTSRPHKQYETPAAVWVTLKWVEGSGHHTNTQPQLTNLT